MMHSPLMKFLGMASWLISALGAIIIGLMPFNYDFFRSPMMMNMPNMVMPLQYLIGAAGVVSLVMFVLSFTMGCGKCCSTCTCEHRK